MSTYHFEAVGDSFGVLDTLANAVIQNGWTIDHLGIDGGSGDPENEDYRRYILVISSGAQIYAFAPASETSGDMRIRSLQAYDPGIDLASQSWSTMTANYLNASGGICHVFSSSTYVYGVVESSVDSFRHFGVGMLTKNDTYSGGQFMASHYTSGSRKAMPYEYAPDNTYLPASLCISWGGDGYGVRWHYNCDDYEFPSRCRGALWSSSALSQNLISATSSQFNRQSVLIPLYIDVLRSANAYYSPVGYPPGIRGINTNYLTDKQVVTLGGDEWMVFPVGERNSSSAGFSSGSVGLAYLRNPA